MARLTGFNKLVAQLYDLSKIHATQVTVTVGYSAEYASYVHEDLTKPHKIGKAKYLEDVIFANQGIIQNEIQQSLTQGKTMTEALEAVGKYILSESRKFVPIDTGFLYKSGYVSVQ